MRLTPLQQAVVDARGQDALISASAGSGKTEVLARRCVSLLLDAEHPTGIDRFLVVTFTRSAAAELRERISRMLRAEVRAAPSRTVRAHLRRQETLLDAAQIGTIDAWCNSLLRAEFAAASVDPCFSVLSPIEACTVRQDERKRLLEWVFTAPAPAAQAGRDWIEAQSKPGDEGLSESIEQLNRYREHLIDPEGWLAANRARATLPLEQQQHEASTVLFDALAQECAAQAAALAGLAAADAGERSFLAAHADQLAAWRMPVENRGSLVQVVAEIKNYRFPRTRGPAAEVAKAWFSKRLAKVWCPDGVQRWLASVPHTAKRLHTLLDLEAMYHARLQAAKQRRATYEFADVQRFALNLLTTRAADGRLRPSPLATQHSRLYDHILVDESQDTNAIQLALFHAVGRTPPDPGNRFFVGDVKQSIYGFRRAEPQLFAQMARQFRDVAAASPPRAGRVFPLTDNFRSHARVLAPLNAIFERLFDPEFGGSEYGPDNALHARRAELDNATLDSQPRVSVTLFTDSNEDDPPVTESEPDAPDDNSDALESIEREAIFAAAQIRQMLDARTLVWSRGGDGPELRSVQLSDFAILLRTARGKAALTAHALRRMGIDAIASGRESLLDFPESQDLLNALRLVVHTRRDVPLAAYLRGPYAGLSDAQLLRVRKATPQGDFLDSVHGYIALGKDVALVAQLRLALGQLERWRRAARVTPLPALLGMILSETGGECFALSQPSGPQRVSALRAFCELSSDFRDQGLSAFVTYLDALEETQDAGPALAPPAVDAVRIMTIHAAKGLEFPIVFLLNAGAKFSVKSGGRPLQLHDALGAGLRFYHRPSRQRWIDPRHPLIGQAAVRREREEELRLLYVASTRARDRLYIVGHAKPDKWDAALTQSGDAATLPRVTREAACSLLDWLLPAIAAAGAHRAPRDDGPPLVDVQQIAVDAHQPIEKHAATASEFRRSRQESGSEIPAPDGELNPADQVWLDQVLANLVVTTAAAPFVPPAVLSVSSLKQLQARGSTTDVPQATMAGFAPLSVPGFIELERPDGRERGNAMHRFLRHVRLSSLATQLEVMAEIERGLAEGWLVRAEASNLTVDQLVRLGASEVGRWLAAHAANVRREQPFVLGLPLSPGVQPTIVRGVIDVFAVCEDGLHLFDYKTDVFATPHIRAERLRGYILQLRLYARAAAEIANVSVRRAALILLSEGTVVDAPLGPLELDTLWPQAKQPATTCA